MRNLITDDVVSLIIAGRWFLDHLDFFCFTRGFRSPLMAQPHNP